MLKTKTKKKKYKKGYIICIIIISILLISNIYLMYNYKNLDKEDKVIEEVLFTKTEDKYNNEKKYYATISYKKFKTLYKSNKITTIAVIDNTSNTHEKFKELVNKMAYYKSTKIHLLELNKLSRKNEIEFYDLDERLPSLESNYIITISNNKIISITTFENTDLNKVIEGLGE